MEITTKLPLADLVKSPNIAKLLTGEDCDAIGSWAVENYRLDKASRNEWEQRNQDAIKLALQVSEAKSFPWTNCSNVKFPLLTVAALQFLARIAILTKGRHLVKMESVGPDPDGQKALTAQRISSHMSMQLLDEDVNWADDDEKAKLAASILGCAIKKSYYDTIQGQTISEYVPAMYFVVDYFCKHTDTAHRMTHLIPMNANRIKERERRGLFLVMAEAAPSSPELNLLREAADEAEGIQRPQAASSDEYEILEQYTWLDLDGDGYAEPYTLWVRLDTEQLLRVAARYFDVGDVYRKHDAKVAQLEAKASATEDLKEKSALEKEAQSLLNSKDNIIVRIDPIKVFTKYTFIPSPDNGFYGLGLGALLGPMNKSVDTLVNQLIDAGTMSNTAGGFLGRGVKLKGGKTSFDPFEWKPVDSTGDDLRKNIMPLPVREPSNVLFQLLGMLVTYGEKISGATDIMTGVSPGQNTPAETSRNTVEQGMMLFSGIYGRMHRAFREELKKRYELNRLFLQDSPQFPRLTSGPNAILLPEDYDQGHLQVYPTADATALSGQQRKDKAGFLLQVSMQQPGFDRYVVTKRLLEAWDIEDIDQVFPDPKGPRAIAPPQNPKIELEKAKLQQAAQEHTDEMQLAVAALKQEVALNEAKIVELQAKATKHLADAQGVETGHEIAMIEAQIGAARARQDGMLGALTLMEKSLTNHAKHVQDQSKQAGASPSEGQPSQPQQPQQ